MIVLALAALAVAAAIIAELVFPGGAIYHYGWYNVLLAAIAVVAFGAGRNAFRRVKSPRSRWAIVTVLAGTAIAAFAGVASGLLAPDNQTIVGAPGERVRVESLGVLVFPVASIDAPSGAVTLERRLRGPVRIGERRRATGNFILRAVQRTVAYAEARDLRGNRLTITQPSGSVFLSPVLMMQHRQTIAGMDLPYDSFNVPAARRIVKAVLFTPEQTAMFSHGAAASGEAAVLFAVDDEKERPLQNAIGLSTGGHPVMLAGLSLRAVVAEYPAVEVVAAPNVAAAIVGALFVAGGLLSLVAGRGLLPGDDRANVAKNDRALGELDAFRG